MATIIQVIENLQNLTNAKISQSDIARAFGITRATVSARVKSHSQVTFDELQKLEKMYNVQLTPKKLSDNLTDDCITFPVLGDVQVSLGYGVTVYDETRTGGYAISKKLAQDLGIKPETSDIIFGTGNSMEPTIQGGDALLVDRTRKDISDGKIYCIRHDGQLKAKRLQKLSKTKLKVISDNKDYESVTIDFSQDAETDFEVIGEIRWCGRIFL